LTVVDALADPEDDVVVTVADPDALADPEDAGFFLVTAAWLVPVASGFDGAADVPVPVPAPAPVVLSLG
jgi:hypothetical protein